MPGAQTVLAGITQLTNQWTALATFWHILLGFLLVALVGGFRPRLKSFGTWLTLPLLSVAALAAISGNPFNAAAFALLWVTLFAVSRHLLNQPITIARGWLSVPGGLLLLFGWTYPHFLTTDSAIVYLYQAPLGLIPCPTLSAVIGLTLLVDFSSSKTWTLTLGIAGLFYGIVGILWLGVRLDAALLAGAIWLVANVAHTGHEGRPVFQTA